VTAIAAAGLSAEVPGGWDGEIFVRSGPEAESTAPPASAARPRSATVVGVSRPVLQLATFALPTTRGDFGDGAVELMGPRDSFVALFEHGPESVGTALFAAQGTPWPLPAGEFGEQRLQRPLPGQVGAQWFFTAAARAFCLYVVLGSSSLRAVLLRPVNQALASIRISPP
jgi:hypothetical protein